MTNIFQSPKKQTTRDLLLSIGFNEIEKAGWSVERVPGIGKSSVRRLRRGQETVLASFKSTQDTWLAFSRTPDDKAWSTLEDVDVVVVISIDDRHSPRFANVHFVKKEDLVPRFDKAYQARLAADHSIPIGRGVWISLYDEEKASPVNLIGAGVGIDFPPIAKVPLENHPASAPLATAPAPAIVMGADDGPLTITEAKRRLALTFGVDPSAVKISVEA